MRCRDRGEIAGLDRHEMAVGSRAAKILMELANESLCTTTVEACVIYNLVDTHDLYGQG